MYFKESFMVIDTHCHLEKEQYENLEEIIEKTK